MNITIIGTGYIGLTEGLCFADLGHNVKCVDIDKDKIEKLSKGIPTLYEDNLESMLKQNLKEGRIKFTTDLKSALQNSKAVFICVDTPENPEDGSADLTAIFNVAESVARKVNPDDKFVLVIRSTVPVGTNKKVQEKVIKINPNLKFEIASNPEFSKQGTAIKDFLKPDRIVVGTETEYAEKIMREVYAPLTKKGHTIFFCNIETAELIKYASNGFLATKIAFINEMADLCEKTGANVGDLAEAMGMDNRISPKFLRAGPGMGGSCFPKDTKALVKIGDENGADISIVRAVVNSNINRKKFLAEKVLEYAEDDLNGKTVSVLGLTFKAGTDDTRYSPALELVKGLVNKNISVKAYDPQGIQKAKQMLSENTLEKVTFHKDAYQAIQNSEVLIIATEWPEFAKLDFKKIFKLLNKKIIIDFRNLLDKNLIKSIGFKYFNVGNK